MTLDAGELERLYAYPAADRPWVRTNFVSTLDGAATGTDGKSGTLGGEADTRVFALLRSLSDVIVVGAGTARDEGYADFEVDTELRARLGLAPAPTMVLVSRRLDIPPALIARGTVVVTTADADPEAVAALGRTLEVIAEGRGEIDWTAVLAWFAERGWNRVLCEGGPSLHGELVGLDLVDELCLTIAPVLTAGDAPRIAHGDDPVHHTMTLAHAIEADGGLLTRWVRSRHP
ncbi:pyrimidine reductase family protein [Aeromicrobium sp. NPDC092404]|uniref:pyrimidine reductase family protein n=1 Tax=Aeromicrobium sp. NPDC092404 TaxID=3154976 RepID=UPI0034214176